jgi:signal transduction histidine kinase
VQAALEELAERTRGYGLNVDLTIGLGADQADAPSELGGADLDTAVYRIVQEALTNAIKHSGARHVVIKVHPEPSLLRVTVRDDGNGFDPQARSTGFGLHGLREYAELLGGTLQINSTPGRGTEITASPPRTNRAS